MKDFLVFNENWGWETIKAYDKESAAEKAGEYFDASGDFVLAADENNSVSFAIKDSENDEPEWFSVSASHYVRYRAALVSEFGVDEYTLKCFQEQEKKEY